MSDVTIKGTADMAGVVKGANQAGKAIERLGKSAGKRRGGAAMSVLEASRAIEDFSVAGMRGAINNIPGLIQSLGGGMGLAGAASLVVVGVWKAVGALDAFLDRIQDAKLAKMETPWWTMANTVELSEKQIRKAEKAAQEMSSTIKKLVDEQSAYAAAVSAYDQSKREGAAQVSNEQEVLDMRRAGKKDDQIEMTKLRQRSEEFKRQLGYIEERAKLEQTSIDSMEIQVENAQRLADAGAAAKAELESWPKTLQTAVADFIRARRAAGDPIGENDMPRIVEDFTKELGMTEARREALMAEIETGAAQQMKLDSLKEELRVRKEKQRIGDVERKTETEKVMTQAHLNKLAAENLKLERQKTEERRQQSIMASLGVNSEGLLSSAARVGLGATEALNSMNIQKNILNVLKSIDRSMRGKLAAYAAA